jgi:putative SOS response-associated peptidase YedK
MCGRFVAATPLPVLAERFGVDEVRVRELPPSWNVAPTDPVPAVVDRNGRRLLGTLRWGLVPSWAPDPSGAARMINARAETVATKPAFREALRRRRCLIPADGFYEWRRRNGRKEPVLLAAADGSPLAFAGLWDVWRRDAQRLATCTIVTTTANRVVGAVHDRMPVILAPDAWDLWLDPGCTDPRRLTALLVPAADDALVVRPADPRVNDVRNNGPELLGAAGREPGGLARSPSD